MSNESPSGGPRFKRGDKVRVKAGVKDPDNPDLPIGHWCGTIDDLDTGDPPPAYLVRWDRRTRDNMHPIFVKRCKRDDLEIDCMWIEEQDLEPDDGSNLPLEQPQEIVTRPLDLTDQEDRIRAVFGLTSDDPVPEPDEGTLRIYHAYLAEHLVVPFEGRWERSGPRNIRSVAVTVLALRPPEETDPEDGILCEVKTEGRHGVLPLSCIERESNTPQGQLIADYAFWVGEWADSPDVLPISGLPLPAEVEGMEVLPGPTIPLRRILHWAGITGAVYGATLGATLPVLEGIGTGMLVGGAILGLLIGLIGRRYGMILGTLNRAPRGPLVGSVLGLLVGGMIGILLGAMAVAVVGSLSGLFAGVILADMVVRRGNKGRAKFLGGLLGACGGAIVQALSLESGAALAGLFIGVVAGIVGGVLLVLTAVFVMAFLMGPPG